MVDVDTRIYMDPNEPVRTQQSAKDECDINIIVARVQKGADVSHLNGSKPYYGSTVGLPSYREMLQSVVDAQNNFNALDAKVRERFANDPGELIAFVDDPANRDEAIKLGLIPKPVEDPVLIPNPKGLGVDSVAPLEPVVAPAAGIAGSSRVERGTRVK